jgi:hypothetical protein
MLLLNYHMRGPSPVGRQQESDGSTAETPDSEETRGVETLMLKCANLNRDFPFEFMF